MRCRLPVPFLGRGDDPGAEGEVETIDTDPDHTPVIGPPNQGEPRPGEMPRLARHQITLADGHRVGIAVCGRGVPLVMVHGFTAEGLLYAQTLSRLVSAGYKVVAIDTAGHGSTQGFPPGGAEISEYSRLLRRVVDHLGIEQAVFVGHSMGGRMVTELAADNPERALSVILLDAIVGETWDRLVTLFKTNPLLLGWIGAVLGVDCVATVPLLRDPGQALKLARLTRGMVARTAINPLRLAGPGLSIIRSTPSKPLLERIRRKGIPLMAIHGDRDIAVPLSTGRSAARLAGGQLVVVEGGTHSWLLKDPETFPAILRESMASRRGQRGRDEMFRRAGIDPRTATFDDLDRAFYEPAALIHRLTPPFDPDWREPAPRLPRFHWHLEDLDLDGEDDDASEAADAA
jgi:pimeloyl-ACP methyl ester carboxylesterase